MSRILSDGHGWRAGRGFCRSAWLLVLLVLLVSIPLAQAGVGAQTSNTRQASASERRVREAVVSRFRVLPVQNGIVLVPLGRYEGVDNIELRDGMIAVNGKVVTGGELRQRLGRDADPVLELSYFDLEAQRRLLLPPAAPEAQQAAPDAVSRPAPEPAPVAPAEPAIPTPAEPERQFRREVEARVRLGGHIHVAEDEQVNGPVVVVGGSIDVNGRVREDVVAVGGNVHLGPRADVHGDVTVIGGTFERESGAVVGGRVNEVGVSWPAIQVRPLRNWDVHFAPWFGDGPWRTFRLLGTLLRMALFALLATLVLLVAPRAVERVDVAVRQQPWKAALIGLFAQLLFVPVLVIGVVLLVISIVGIPLLVLVPFAVLGFFVALLLGFVGSATALARSGQDRFRWSPGTSFTLLFVGLVLIWGTTVAGRMVSLGGGPLTVLGALLLFVGFMVEYAAWTVGLGGALMTRMGRSGRLVEPPVPPVPVAPVDVPVEPLPPDLSTGDPGRESPDRRFEDPQS
ncbi:MAG TPA: polymer-forming cytoskeletal protein [Vicinamibacterales bacterium]|jgi:hypothetical protein